MTFYTGKMFPAKYKGAIFSTQHGSWNRTEPVGARIMVTFLKDDGTSPDHRFRSPKVGTRTATISAARSTSRNIGMARCSSPTTSSARSTASGTTASNLPEL